MDLTPDPLAERLSRTVRARLATVVRSPGDAETLSALTEMNAFAFEAPVAAGGFDLGLTCGVVVGSELGRRALPDLYSDPALVVGTPSALGERKDLAADILAGESVVSSAGLQATASGRSGVRAARAGGGWALTGAVAVDDEVPDEASCCVPVEVDEGEVVLGVLPARIWRRRVRGATPLAVLELDGVVLPDHDVIGRLGAGNPLSDPDRILARARVRQAGYLLGLGQGAHELAVEHAGGRRQFGRSLLDFQAVSFALAQDTVALTGVRLSVYRAAWLADSGEPFELAAAESLALASEVALRVTRTALQVHGAWGMSLQAPVHAFHPAVRQASTRLGSPGQLWRQAGRHRLQAVARTPAAGAVAVP
jgi:alkylation response protein AidB-like acyl-CoA dehydrogenase